MSYLHDSLTAHAQNWMSQNFERTKAGRNLKKYKGIHEGERCFFIGNGPSLRAEDLTLIAQSGCASFAFNRIYYIFDQTDWRPTYYISQDEFTLGGCQKEVNQMNLPHKFVPVNLRWYFDIHIQNAEEYFLDGDKDQDFWFSDNIPHSFCWANTVMYTAAQLAVYMGFKTIYLIGVDHHFHISEDKDGNIVVDDSVKDYFTDEYNKDRENLVVPNTDISTNTYIAMRKYCDERGIRVLNATRGGRLEVFDRVDFENLMREWGIS